MKKLYMIGNTHFDPVWLWRWDEALASIRSTFRSALDRMNENPDFIYSFCTPAVFEWIEKTDIKLFEEIKKREQSPNSTITFVDGNNLRVFILNGDKTEWVEL